ncbi:MAG: beta-galactosidase, partial [Ruminococcus sp.]|nr:beta-galactosidase [Ruminococcus sp.]
GTAENYGKSGDILLLAVGINDYTKAYKNNPVAIDSADYITYTTDMIQRAKAKGMTVYLVKQQGELNDCTTYPLPNEKWFSDAIDEMAKAENVGIIDMFHPWLEFCLEKTKAVANNYYYNNVHPNLLGADKLAQIVSEQLFSTDKPEKVIDDPYTDFDTSTAISYQTETSGQPVSNPHKGFVMTLYNPDMLYSTKHPYGINGSMDNHAWDVATICSGVMFWKDINPKEDVYNWEEIDKALEACEQSGRTYGIRIIPYTTSTGSDDNYGAEHDFVPQWVYDKGAKQDIATYKYGDPNIKIKVPNWSDPVYIDAYKKFTKALAERYDGDPRVEYVEIRSFGNMGEWHTSDFEGNEMPSVEIQKDMLDDFASVFKHTTCCVLSDAVGEIYDYALSIGITKRNNGLIMAKNAEWDLRPAYKANLPTMADNHNTYKNMLKQDNTSYLKWTPEHFRECIEIAHLSIFALDQDGQASYDFYREQKDVIDEMCNRIGYNFTVTSAKRNGSKLKVTIKNTGLASAFFNISLCAEITDQDGNKLENFGKPVPIEKGSFHDEDEKAFLFEYDGTLDENAVICLAMYDSDNPLAKGKNPTVRFDNKNTFSTNRLHLVPTETVLGDVNVDGAFNIADAVLLHKWLLTVPNTYLADWKAADFCNDNVLDVCDLCLMKRKLLKK